VVADWLNPGIRRWLCPKRRFPIADAHYLMGFVGLYRLTGNEDYLDSARELAQALLASSLPGFSGHCWGYPFDWQTKRGLWKQGIPFITTTPYVFDAFVDLYGATGDTAYLDIARSTAVFVAKDIRHMPVGQGSAASYTPIDEAQVVNASAYRAACMVTAAHMFQIAEYQQLAIENVRFILDQQRTDGSWLYSVNDPKDAFIDHFHTCFVLKGLYRVYSVTQDAEILSAIQRGYAFYRQALFYPNGRPRPFARVEDSQLRRLELYDYAEAIHLALVLEPVVDTQNLSHVLVADLLSHWQLQEGFFMTRVAVGGIKNCTPYHRWAQSQTFFALVQYANRHVPLDNRRSAATSEVGTMHNHRMT
jgi:hypothetical protein